MRFVTRFMFYLMDISFIVCYFENLWVNWRIFFTVSFRTVHVRQNFGIRILFGESNVHWNAHLIRNNWNWHFTETFHLNANSILDSVEMLQLRSACENCVCVSVFSSVGIEHSVCLAIFHKFLTRLNSKKKRSARTLAPSCHCTKFCSCKSKTICHSFSVHTIRLNWYIGK